MLVNKSNIHQLLEPQTNSKMSWYFAPQFDSCTSNSLCPRRRQDLSQLDHLLNITSLETQLFH